MFKRNTLNDQLNVLIKEYSKAFEEGRPVEELLSLLKKQDELIKTVWF